MRRAHGLTICTLLAATILWIGWATASEPNGEETFVVIKAGRVITVAGREYDDAEIVLVDGKVHLVGKGLKYPGSAKVIDARKEVVMPGLIHVRSRYELPSYSRSGIHGDLSVAREVYVDDIDLQPLVEAGFTAVCLYPTGSGITGRAVVYRTAGENQQRVLGPAYLRVTMANPASDKKTLRSAVEKARKEIEKVEKARKEWEEKQQKAKAEAARKEAEKKESGKQEGKPTPEKQETGGEKKDQGEDKGDTEKGVPEEKAEQAKPQEKKPDVFVPPPIDPAVKPLVDWIRDKKGPPLLFELSSASDLRHLDDVLKEASELPGNLLYLAGGYSPDYNYVLKDLGCRKATVAVAPTIGYLPYTVVYYHLPAELALAGCTVALTPDRDRPTALKEFRTQLAELVRAGLPRELALRAVTLNAAKVLGMEQRLGSIEKGKEADLIFLDGDPLDTGSRVTRVMTSGKIVWEAEKQP